MNNKMRALIMLSYTSGRAVATVDQEAERTLINSGMMDYQQKPLMVITKKGREWAKKRASNGQ